jgi:hypothetical protein
MKSFMIKVSRLCSQSGKKYAKIFYIYTHPTAHAVDITLVNNKLSMFVVVGKGKQ